MTWEDQAAKKKETDQLRNVIKVLSTVISKTENIDLLAKNKDQLKTLCEMQRNYLLKSFPEQSFEEPEIDLEFLNIPEVTEESYLCQSTILSLTHLNYLNFQDSFVSPKLKNEISEISLMEKIVFLVLSFYVLATEHWFVEHQEKCINPFYKVLLHFLESKSEEKSEIFLSTGVELAYQFSSENFPVINQIFSVFKKFELNLGKVISESQEEGQAYKFLLPLKNGFRNSLIIPLFKEGVRKKNLRAVDEELESVNQDAV